MAHWLSSAYHSISIGGNIKLIHSSLYLPFSSSFFIGFYIPIISKSGSCSCSSCTLLCHLSSVHTLCHLKSGLMPPCIIQWLYPCTLLNRAGMNESWQEKLSGRMGSHIVIRGLVSELSGPCITRYLIATQVPRSSLLLSRFGHFERIQLSGKIFLSVTHSCKPHK